MFDRVPIVVLTRVLSEWVETSDLTYFDSAATTTTFRSSFTQILQSKQFYLCGGAETVPKSCFDWLLLRSVKMGRINLSNYSEKAMPSTVVQIFKNQSKIQHVEMRYCANLEHIVEACPYIESLNLFCSADMTDDELLELCGKISGLKHITLTACETVTAPGMKRFIEAHPKLESFDLGMYDLPSTDVDEIFRKLAETCPNLRKITCPEYITDKGLKHIAENCPLLESLKIEDCTKITDKSIVRIAQYCPKLKKLCASKCNVLTDESVLQIAKHCPDMVILDVEASQGVTDVGLTAVAKKCHKIRSLVLYDCDQLTSTFLNTLGRHCALLSHLYLTGCAKMTDKSVVALARGCPHLQALYLNGSKKLTDVALTALLTHCPHLTCLNTSDTKMTAAPLTIIAHDLLYLELDASGADYLHAPPYDQRPYDLSKEDVDYTVKLIPHTTRTRERSLVYTNPQALCDAETLRSIIQQCSSTLRTFKIINYSYLTDEDLELVIDQCPQLHCVSVANCESITNGAFILVAERCKLLTSYEIRGQPVGDESVGRIVDICGKRLTHLSLKGCGDIMDTAVRVIANACPDLTSLDLSMCIRLTDDGVRAVLHKCTKLQSLCISNIYLISEETLHEISQVCTVLAKLDIRGCYNINNIHTVCTNMLLSVPTLKMLLYCDDSCYQRDTEFAQ